MILPFVEQRYNDTSDWAVGSQTLEPEPYNFMVKVICNDYAANGYTKQPINYIFIVYAEFDNESRVAGYDLLSNPATFFWGQS